MEKYRSKLHEQIATSHEQRQGKGFRKHLGMSLIGRRCARQLWYTFRWARRSFFPARILRLFERGDREEEYLVRLMRKAGIHVEDVDPETGKQFRASDHNGHFAGSLDAKIHYPPDFPEEVVLGEFKTHNLKSFNALQKQGLEKHKPEHKTQADLYMHYHGLDHGIYFAVCKDNDELDTILLECDKENAEMHRDKARKIIFAIEPPIRINESPGWYECKFCDFKQVCHFHEKKEMNCRTCIHSQPDENGEWFCGKFQCTLEYKDQLLGCIEHEEIPE